MDLNMVRLYDIYSPLLNDRQREVLDLYYNEDESLGEISENVGITRQGVRDCIIKAENALSNYEKALGLEKKISSVTDEITEIVKILSDGDSKNAVSRLNKLKDSLD